MLGNRTEHYEDTFSVELEIFSETTNNGTRLAWNQSTCAVSLTLGQSQRCCKATLKNCAWLKEATMNKNPTDFLCVSTTKQLP